MQNYRTLNKDEINLLSLQNCQADNWDTIYVTENFDCKWLKNVQMSGYIYLGNFQKTHILPGGIPKHSGIYNASIHNCSIGDDCLIENIGEYIANYIIESNVIIQLVGRIFTKRKSNFANSSMVSVLNETGGREIKIYNNMSSHIAYMQAFYRHNTKLIDNLYKIIDEYGECISSEKAKICSGTIITNVKYIKNVNIGNNCRINGCSKLDTGSINSNNEAPCYIGHNVIAEHFIIASGSEINDGATIIRCYVGQACSLKNYFIAHDSVFFSNCICENGETCASFAGPYTVTMHKSSLLIAGLFSFMNAGSGSNQSNHMYKLGAIHQGITARGCKASSDSYVMWPANIGAYSLIMGRHYRHPDTSTFPFSYLVENEGKSYLIPGVNIRSAGTIRDAIKWKQRDKRKDSIKSDNIIFDMYSPLIMSKIKKAIETLKYLDAKNNDRYDTVIYNNTIIHNHSIKRSIKIYQMAFDIFFGDRIVRMIKNAQDIGKETSGNNAICTNIDLSKEEILKAVNITYFGNVCDNWIDMAGLICPQNELENIIHDIENEKLRRIEDIDLKFLDLYNKYDKFAWDWTRGEINKLYNLRDKQYIDSNVLRTLLDRWKIAKINLNKWICEDAEKEFSEINKIGFGIDGDTNTQNNDFVQVRGTWENNDFVKNIKADTQNCIDLHNTIITILNK